MPKPDDKKEREGRKVEMTNHKACKIKTRATKIKYVQTMVFNYSGFAVKEQWTSECKGRQLQCEAVCNWWLRIGMQQKYAQEFITVFL